MMRKLIIILMVPLIFVFSCKKNKDKEEVSLLEGNWVLTDIQNTETNSITNFPLGITEKIEIEFTGPDTILFRGICNNGDGIYSHQAATGELIIKDLVVTKVYCTNIEWEGFSVQNLNKAYKYEITGDSLKIYSTGDYNLFFVRKATNSLK